MIWCIAFDYDIISYLTLLDFLYFSPRFARDVATANFTTIQDSVSYVSLKEEFLLIP
jgi:hypothetical protein